MLLVPLALASGVQAIVFPSGLDRATALVSDTSYAIEYDDIGGPYECWDYLGVRYFNLDIPIDGVSGVLREGVLEVRVTFGEIRGEGMEVYALDEEYTDACVEFEAWVSYIRLAEAEIEAELSVSVEEGRVRLSVVGTPEVSGDLDADIDDFPDDLVLYFFEEAILTTLGESIAEYLPPALDEVLANAVLGGSAADFTFALTPTDADLSEDGLWMAARGEVGWTGEDGCPTDGPVDDGRNPDLDFGDGGEATFAVGLTEGMVNELFQTLWRDGYFCFTEENVEEFMGRVASLFDPDVASLEGTASLDEPPLVTIDADGMTIDLAGANVRVTGELQGERVELLATTLSARARMDLRLDQGLSAFTVSLRDLDLDIHHFEADHLLAGDAEAEGHLRDFLEGWVVEWAESATQDVALYQSLYRLWDFVLRVDRLDYEAGGVKLFLTLFAADDPAVDQEAPETTAEATSLGGDEVRIRWQGTDDREGVLVGAVRVDGGSWSAWTDATTIDLPGITEGEHTVEVTSRDAWLNEDLSPARLTFSLSQLVKENEAAQCACGSSSGGARAALFLALVALVRRSTRR